MTIDVNLFTQLSVHFVFTLLISDRTNFILIIIEIIWINIPVLYSLAMIKMENNHYWNENVSI